jgi:hypothetical protein
MDIFIKHLENIINATLRKQERNFLSELRLTEAILRSEINELNTKINKLIEIRSP